MNIFAITLLVLQAQLATAGGIVTRPGGTEPLGGATVMLNPVAADQASRLRFAISEDDGRFTIGDIEPGEYRLQVQSQRYGSASYGERRPNGPGAILKISSGQRLSDLKVSLQPTGTIAGRIRGRSGEPLAHATVQALKYVYQEGKRFLSVVQATTTDDRGEYRLFWLTGGKYVVVAGPRGAPLTTEAKAPLRPGETIRSGQLALLGIAVGSLTSDALLEGSNLTRRILEDGTIRDESWMPTYYPATTDRAQATAIDVTVGSTVTGIDITLGPSPVQKIRGRVTGFAPATRVTVSLTSGTQGMVGRITNKSMSSVDGSFEFEGIVPGLYFLSAQDGAGLVAAATAVLVGDRDVENLSIALAPAVTVSAQIVAEGVPQGPLDSSTLLNGLLRPDLDTEGGANLRQIPAQLKGNLVVFTNVPPGDYQFGINQPVLRAGSQGQLQLGQEQLLGGNGKPLYIKSIRLGRADAFGTFRVSSNMTEVLEVVLTTETGSLEGVAAGRTGDPAPNATVVLVPATARKRSAYYRTLVTGSDGKFSFQEIPPGDYKLFAWDDIETGAWENAEFIRAYESRGREIRVSEKSKEEVQLNVIYNP